MDLSTLVVSHWYHNEIAKERPGWFEYCRGNDYYLFNLLKVDCFPQSINNSQAGAFAKVGFISYSSDDIIKILLQWEKYFCCYYCFPIGIAGTDSPSSGTKRVQPFWFVCDVSLKAICRLKRWLQGRYLVAGGRTAYRFRLWRHLSERNGAAVAPTTNGRGPASSRSNLIVTELLFVRSSLVFKVTKTIHVFPDRNARYRFH